MFVPRRAAAAALAIVVTIPLRGAAQESGQAATAQATTTPQEDADGVVFRAAEPDFTLIDLPTGLPLGTHKSAFRITHRFTRPLNEGSFGNLASNLFGLDNGAQIGLEYRFGIIPHGQIGVHRTSDRTIEIFSEYEVVRQSADRPVGVSAVVNVEGTENLSQHYQPTVGAVVSWLHADHVALYVEPMWVGGANLTPTGPGDPRSTFMVGLGARVRVRPTVYVVAETAPRAAGYSPDAAHRSIAIEKTLGGHVFQLNFSDSFATTMGQIARGGPSAHDWFVGFNISRKFY